MKRKAARRRVQTAESRAYLGEVAKLPCAACKGRPVECHHPRGLEFGTGMGLRASDFLAIPLCKVCHDEFHTLGRQSWEAKHGTQRGMIEETQQTLGKSEE